ncbi:MULTISPECIES: DUF6434 domain-containing protein [Enterococcus]|uniref:SAP domain-containing protein n=1 Tax=Enterococcus malodoratus ATCC 43197 TaxID=1158601 RepID=R2R8Y4_9ENTE|nr:MULTISPECIES: DUF6434 domain-containing protein [Enterococcus]EOH72424.1 hypothetical protein UAI_04009 [Enterococcus malodoratus ATCC 43197]EOT70250.1 hypothetical protein I585_01729 [Enterococcus malodoratus ATCC 43197]SPW74012.1 Uncharacterised protein [Enterococcus malodoratus]STD65462.1 Uncharacterised protein [Enterococcus malodoratus]HCM86532.1 hypothetical protein [Enterococcus sp.]
MTENRPKLQAGLAPEVFSEYYYLKVELQDFCQEQGLAKPGSKADLNQRITHYLRTGERLASKSSEKKVFREEYLTLDSLIEQGIVFSEKHRAFFKSELGDTFVFKVAFQNWLKENAGKTYREAIAIYPEIAARKPKKIDSQFEYNTYIRDFFADNRGRSLQEAIACWKHKKALPGSNKYHVQDLSALESD